MPTETTESSPATTGKRALVHIGAHKTGTTSIQRTLARAQRQGSLTGVTYPLLRGVEQKVRAKHPFFFAYRPLAKLPPGMKRIYDSAPGRARLAEDVAAYRADLAEAAATAEHLILSSEDLMTFPPASIEDFRDDLAGLGITEITPVIYVRDPVARYLSSVQQVIKASGTFTPPHEHQDWTLTFIRRWRTYFPNLIVRPFDRAELHGGDAVADFLRVASQTFGLDLENGRISPVQSNESISAEGMIILQRYRSAYHAEHEGIYQLDSDRLIRLLQRSLQEIPQTKPRLNAAATAVLTANHRDFLDDLRTEYGFDLRPGASGPAVGTGDLDTDAADPGAIAHPFGTGPIGVADILEAYDPAVLDRVMLWVVHQVLARRGRASAESAARA